MNLKGGLVNSHFSGYEFPVTLRIVAATNCKDATSSPERLASAAMDIHRGFEEWGTIIATAFRRKLDLLAAFSAVAVGLHAVTSL